VIRKARMSDVKDIHKLIESYAEKGEMLMRSLPEIYENIRDYNVYTLDSGKIAGVCAMHIFRNRLAEVRSLAVKRKYVRSGIGTALTRVCIKEAKAFGINRIFSLTYRPEFFEKLGFRIVDKSLLPQKIWNDCLNCPRFSDCNETALILKY